MKKVWLFLVSLVIISALAVGYFLFGDPAHSKNRTVFVVQFIRNPDLHKDWKIAAGDCTYEVEDGSPHRHAPQDGFIYESEICVGERAADVVIDFMELPAGTAPATCR